MAFASTLASFAWASSALAGMVSHTGIPGTDNRVTTGPGSSVSNVSNPTSDVHELLLMDVMYDQLRVDNALSVLQDKQGRRYVPVRQFAATLGFRLHVDMAKETVNGFLNSPSERLDLDGLKGAYRFKGVAGKFDPKGAFARDGDLYLDADLFCRIAGLHLLWQMNLLQLEVSSNSPLNIEKQWIQRARQSVLDMADVAQKSYRTVPIPYKLWSVPSVDAQIYSAGATSAALGSNATSVNISGSGDLLMMSAQYRVMSDSNGNPTALLSLGRTDPGGELLGSLHATQFSFGDLYLPAEPLLARGRNAIGMTISNATLPGEKIRQLGQIRGRVAPGSQVELYEHDQLLGMTTADESGDYHFSGLQFDRGPNVLQIVVISPDGEVRQETRKVYGGTGGPELGQTQYALTAGRIGSSVFGADTFGQVQNEDTTEVIAHVDRGLGNGAWLTGVASVTSGQGGLDQQLGLGLHSWLGPVLWNANSMVSIDGGVAASTGFARQFGNINASLERTQATGTMAARILPEIGANGTSLTSLNLDSSYGHHGISTSYGLSFDRLDGESPATLLRGRFAQGNQNLMFSNSLTTRVTEAGLQASGYSEIRKSLTGGQIGLLDFGYDLAGGPPLELARVTLNRSLSSIYSARWGVEYDATRTQPVGVLGTIYHALGPIDVGVNLELLQRGSITASLLFSTAMRGEGSRNGVALARPGASDTGTAIVRAFLDKHLTGRYEPDDPLLPDVSFLINGHPRSISTGKDGKAVIDRLSPNERTSISADEESFQDPSWVSENPGVTTVPRPGRAIAIDFPVLETAEMEGRLIAPKGAVQPGLTAELIDANRKVADTSILDAGGTYVFSRVRPGAYHIRLVDLAGNTIHERSVTVSPGAIMKAVDIDGAASPTYPGRP